MKYRKKPVVIEAITFEELVEYGKSNGADLCRASVRAAKLVKRAKHPNADFRQDARP